MTAFVIGNGESRKNIPVDDLKKHGMVIGCNAIYRDFNPHFVVTADPDIALEISKSKYIDRNKVYTSYRDISKLHDNFILETRRKRFCAGIKACMVAIEYGQKELYLLGNDLGSTNGLINNCYKNTPCYKKNWEDDKSHEIHIPQYISLIRNNGNIKFIRAMGKQSQQIPEFTKLKNYNEINIADFISNFEL